MRSFTINLFVCFLLIFVGCKKEDDDNSPSDGNNGNGSSGQRVTTKTTEYFFTQFPPDTKEEMHYESGQVNKVVVYSEETGVWVEDYIEFITYNDNLITHTIKEEMSVGDTVIYEPQNKIENEYSGQNLIVTTAYDYESGSFKENSKVVLEYENERLSSFIISLFEAGSFEELAKTEYTYGENGVSKMEEFDFQGGEPKLAFSTVFYYDNNRISEYYDYSYEIFNGDTTVNNEEKVTYSYSGDKLSSKTIFDYVGSDYSLLVNVDYVYNDKGNLITEVYSGNGVASNEYPNEVNYNYETGSGNASSALYTPIQMIYPDPLPKSSSKGKAIGKFNERLEYVMR